MMNRILTSDQEKVRLDTWLAKKIPELTRSRIQSLIQQGQVSVNQTSPRASTKLHVGDKIIFSIPQVQPLAIEAESIPLNILYEDDQLVVLNKVSGIITHPGAGHSQGTLVNALLHHCKGSLSGIGGVERPGIVHRLDKETSGVLLIAKTDLAHQSLSQQFKNRTVQKFYHVLVESFPKNVSGEITANIGRHPTQRKKMTITPRGRTATTRYRLIEKFKTSSFLECQILTGRTHQIRVHLTSIGCSVLGDKTYGKASEKAPRQMLHAAQLIFQHPTLKTEMRMIAPLPDDFAAVLNELRHGTS